MSVQRPTGLAVLCAFLALAPCRATGMELSQIIRVNEPATLVITGRRKDNGASVQGSGFCVDTTRGLVLVTAHQVTGVEHFQGRLATGEVYDLALLAVDTRHEAALLQANRPLPHAVVLGDALTLERGDPLVCIASPRNLEFTVVRGIVSGRPRLYRGMSVIQTDVPASPGSSGGPVFDRFGNAVGYIILYLEKENWVVFANPINNAYDLLRSRGVRIPDASLPAYDDATLVPARDITERERRAIESYNRGVASDSPEAKVTAYKVAVQLLPEFYEAQFNLGVAHQSAGDLEAALGAYQAAARLRPRDAAVYRNLGRTYLALKRYQEGAETFEVARDLAPDVAQSHNDLGVAYRYLERNDEAEAQFRKAVVLDPEHAGARYNLALALAAKGSPTEAIRHFEAYLALRPGASDATRVRGWIEELRQ